MIYTALLDNISYKQHMNDDKKKGKYLLWEDSLSSLLIQ